MNPDNCIHCGTALTLTDGEERMCEKCGRVFDSAGVLLSIPAESSDYGSVPPPKAKKGKAAG